MKKYFKITSDGSHTLYVEGLDETYHSKHGAIQEADHVFINAGFNYFDQPNLEILEIGFGTGLNTFLTYLASKETDVNVNYTALEAFPLDQDLTSQLNYTKQLNSSSIESAIFNKMHQVIWNEFGEIAPRFNLFKAHLKLNDFLPALKFNLIYFDAFGPNIQPELWTEEVFVKMYNALLPGGVLVTYCAKGTVKRALKKVGFELESLPGPPGKREMSRAIKK